MKSSDELERIATGIGQLDHLLGGFPKGRTILVTGDPGSCKTILGLQYTNQCCMNGLRTTYVTTEESIPDLIGQARSFGWDFKDHIDKGRLTLIELLSNRVVEIETAMSINVPAHVGTFENILESTPKGTQALIIDSLGSHAGDLTPRTFKDRLDVLVNKLNTLDISTMLILDSATSHEYNDLALFSVYGAIRLMKRENPYTGARERVMDIVKMRNTKTPIQLLTFDIAKEGIFLLSVEKMALTV
jgi:KaiC/GvpD/RAD55 family RecA-like ATPase